MKYINEIKKLILFPRTLIQLMFQKKTNSKKLFNSKLNIHHSTFKTQHSTFITQHSKFEVYMFSLIKIILVITTTLVVLLTNLSCHRTPIEPEKTKVNLIYEDALCTEAYFRLKTTEINYPARVDLYLNKNKVNSFTTFSEDTVFVIENLLPKKSYTSYVRVYPEGGRELVSSEVSFVTMDTTSHNFTWQVFEFGQWGNSVLFDVAIIDENNIWAVGEIRVYDSLGRAVKYNAVHWDGSKWELKKIAGEGWWKCRTIFAFSANNIWFDARINWDGARYNIYTNGWPLLPNGDGWQVNKVWGTSSNDLYAVGDYGNIAHWDGWRWKKIESGTNIGLINIWGTSNGDEIYCCGAPDFGPTILLRLEFEKTKKIYENFDVTQIYPDKISGAVTCGIIFSKFKHFILTTKGLYKILDLEKLKAKRFTFEEGKFYGYPRMVSGNDANDLFIVGDYFMIAHFNGIRLNPFRELYGLGIFRSVSFKDKTVVAVGLRIDGYFTKAFIVKGNRIN